MTVTWKKLAYEDDVITKTLFDAYSIIVADVDNTPTPLTVAVSNVVGRKASGGIVSLTKAELLTILNVADGATANAKASGAEIDAGNDDTKFVTASGLWVAHNVPTVVPGALNNVMTSNGDHWISQSPGAPAAHSLSNHTAAIANIALAGFQATDQVIHTVANVAAVNAYATPVVGKMLWSTAELSPYICTVAV